MGEVVTIVDMVAEEDITGDDTIGALPEEVTDPEVVHHSGMYLGSRANFGLTCL